MSDSVSLIVRCSCGREAVITWNEPPGRYQCTDPEWRYSGSCDPEERLWYCGRPGHRQDWVRDKETARE